jgi:hypothetical protein
MRAEGYRVHAIVAGLLIIVMGCAGPQGTAPAGSSSAQGSPAIGVSATGPASAPPDATGSARPSSTADAPVRLRLSGRGPIGMAIADGVGWVVATDSGHLISLDMATATETAAIDIGAGGSSVVIGDDGTAYVSRYDTGSTGEGILVVKGRDHAVSGIATMALGGLAAGEAGTVWALEKAGNVLHVDPAARRILDRVAVAVDTNEHMEIVAGAGARWVSSDHTPVRRIAADATVAAVIETGGGIPLDFADGLVWGARADELWAIDPRRNEVTRHVALEDVAEILALDVEGDEAWLAVRRPGRVGAVVRLELPGGRVVAGHAVSLPAAVELAADRAWVTDYDTSEVLGFAR